jgi:hypothetical protein
MSLISKLASLTPDEWGLILRAAVLVSLTGMLLPVFSLRRVRSMTTAVAASLAWMAGRRPVPVDRILWAVAATARRSIFKATCLTKAIAGQALFSSYGYATRLELGGKYSNGVFEAHAWLEWEGEVLLGGPRSVTAEYTPFPQVDELTV